MASRGLDRAPYWIADSGSDVTLDSASFWPWPISALTARLTSHHTVTEHQSKHSCCWVTTKVCTDKDSCSLWKWLFDTHTAMSSKIWNWAHHHNLWISTGQHTPGAILGLGALHKGPPARPAWSGILSANPLVTNPLLPQDCSLLETCWIPTSNLRSQKEVLYQWATITHDKNVLYE